MIDTGSDAEEAALAFLRAQGLRLIARNYRCRFGEIDLIMGEGRTLVFVEVRLRMHSNFGGAAESITSRKKNRILAAARHYLVEKGSIPNCRFDAVLLSGNQQLTWIRDAFGE